MAPSVEQPDADAEVFIERTTINDGMSAAATSAFAGTLVSAVQNSLSTHSEGAKGIFTRSGGTIALFTAMGGVFSFTDSFVANTRRKNDALNGAAGGCAAGLVAGAGARSIPMMVGSCAALATLIGTFDAAGRSISGSFPHAEPIFGAKATKDGVSIEGGESGAHGGRGWREERERRRQNFFKVSLS
ncbi:hypothetical protein CBS101457_005227 [Exobasidium rhododendri]|nr:hypothetical protein CBS101457_005227 [Exobasidium rhododendri]